MPAIKTPTRSNASISTIKFLKGDITDDIVILNFLLVKYLLLYGTILEGVIKKLRNIFKKLENSEVLKVFIEENIWKPMRK